jgi:hypothetical protein
MKLITSLLALATVTVFAADEPNTLTPADKAAGWRLLFDGRTTAEWIASGKEEFPAKGWVVDDGTLHHAKGGGGGDIVTREMFADFELTWDWKIAAGANSGLKYNLPDSKKGIGFEYQLLDDTGHPDGQIGGRLHQTAGLYDVLEPPAERKLNPPGEWNHSRIVVRGNHAEHWLNGAKTVEFEMGSDALKAAIAKSKFKAVPGFGEKTKSPLLLQDHGDEIWFRSIKVRTR